jgi:hypothetical protein
MKSWIQEDWAELKENAQSWRYWIRQQKSPIACLMTGFKTVRLFWLGALEWMPVMLAGRWMWLVIIKPWGMLQIRRLWKYR